MANKKNGHSFNWSRYLDNFVFRDKRRKWLYFFLRFPTERNGPSKFSLVLKCLNWNLKKLIYHSRNTQSGVKLVCPKIDLMFLELLRREILNLMQNLSHPGIRTTRKYITSKYFSIMNADEHEPVLFKLFVTQNLQFKFWCGIR